MREERIGVMEYRNVGLLGPATSLQYSTTPVLRSVIEGIMMNGMSGPCGSLKFTRSVIRI